MPSPFPGMDPYLEQPKLWPAFQHQLLACLYQILLPGLVDRYRARVGTRTYTSEMALFTSVVKEDHSFGCSRYGSIPGSGLGMGEPPGCHACAHCSPRNGRARRGHGAMTNDPPTTHQ